MIKCKKCNQKAVWVYEPYPDRVYFCDDCVPRGCSCNLIPGTDEEDVDEKGRLLPCCEYGFNENGFL